MSSDLGVVEQWVYDTLAGDEDLADLVDGVYGYVPPRGEKGIVVTFQPSVMEDQMAMAGERISTAYLVTVKASGPDCGMAAVDTVAAAIDGLLHKAYDPNAAGSGLQLSCVRAGQVSYTEVTDGRVWYNRGGTFQVWLHT